jgi:hypothetical protein
VTLDDILSRTPELLIPYRSTNERALRCIPGRVSIRIGGLADVRILRDAVVGITDRADEIRQLFGVPGLVGITENSGNINYDAPHFYYALPQHLAESHLPHVEERKGGRTSTYPAVAKRRLPAASPKSLCGGILRRDTRTLLSVALDVANPK